MAQRPDLSRYLDAGAQFVALTRAQARARAKELVGQGQLAQEQVQGFVDELVDESRKRTDEMLDVVRREIQRQVKTLGIATKDDLARLESRLATRSTSGKQSPVKVKRMATTTAKKATTKGAKHATKKSGTAAKPAKAAKKGAKKGAKRSSKSGA
jgi:polyhydroxyalkanoate synthesis regulator phasin